MARTTKIAATCLLVVLTLLFTLIAPCVGSAGQAPPPSDTTYYWIGGPGLPVTSGDWNGTTGTLSYGLWNTSSKASGDGWGIAGSSGTGDTAKIIRSDSGTGLVTVTTSGVQNSLQSVKISNSTGGATGWVMLDQQGGSIVTGNVGIGSLGAYMLESGSLTVQGVPDPSTGTGILGVGGAVGSGDSFVGGLFYQTGSSAVSTPVLSLGWNGTSGTPGMSVYALVSGTVNVSPNGSNMSGNAYVGTGSQGVVLQGVGPSVSDSMGSDGSVAFSGMKWKTGSGGTVTTDNLYLGTVKSAGSTNYYGKGDYNLLSGTLNVTNNLSIGMGSGSDGYSKGSFEQGYFQTPTGNGNLLGNGTSMVTVGGNLYLGTGGAEAEYQLYNGTLVVTGGIYIAPSQSYSNFTQGNPYWDATALAWKTSSANSVSAANLYIGTAQSSGNSPSYNLADGTLTVTGNTYVGSNGPGSFTQGQAWTDDNKPIAAPGGTFTTGNLYVGMVGTLNGEPSSYYMLANGTLQVGAFNNGKFSPIGTAYIGYNGQGNFTQGQTYDNGNSVFTPGGTFTTGSLYLGYNAGSLGNYNLECGTLNTGSTYVGYNGTGFFSQGAPNFSGGSAPGWVYPSQSYAASHTTGSLYIGGGPGSSASGNGGYNLYEGTLTVNGDTVVGYNGHGSFNQGGKIEVTWTPDGQTQGTVELSDPTSGGVFTTNNLFIGGAPGSSGGSGNYQLASGSLTVSGNTYVGYSGSGVFNQGWMSLNNTGPVVTDGGTFTNTGDLYVGLNSGGNNPSSYNLSAGTLAVTGNTYVAYNGVGNFNLGAPLYNGNGKWTYPSQSPYAASHTTENLYIGGGPGSSASGNGGYSLYEGTLTVHGDTVVGYNGHGWFTQGGQVQIGDGTLGKTVYSQATSGGTFTTNNLYIGYNSGSSGSYTLASGALNVAGVSYVGYNGWGAFNQSGGSHTAGAIVIGKNGSYNYSGGTITTTGIVQNGVPVNGVQNNGWVNVTGGSPSKPNTFGASVSNNGFFNVNDANVIFADAVTNNSGGIFTITESNVTFEGLVTNHGNWNIDPSTLTFTGDFINSGDISATNQDILQFLGSGTETFDLGGQNLTILSLVIGPGVTLDLTGGGSLTVEELTEGAGSSYAALNGTTFDLNPVPGPATLLLLLPGLAGLAAIRRKFYR